MMVDEMKLYDVAKLPGLLGAGDLLGDLRGGAHDVTCDSREVEPGVLFVAVRGCRVDGHRFLHHAADRGAIAALVEKPSPSLTALPQIVVGNTRKALGIAAAEVHRHPTAHFPLVGVIGTNGKTTVVYLFRAAVEAAGLNCGLMGTIEYSWNKTVIPAVNTTPGADVIQRLCRTMIDEGVDAAGTEVSSHAVSLERVTGVRFAALALTNVTRDHLDFHGSPAAYRAAKERLFRKELRQEDGVEVDAAVLNIDDATGGELASTVGGRLITYGFGEGADLRGTLLRSHAAGLHLGMEFEGKKSEVALPLPGEFNGANALAAAALALQLDIDLEQIADGLSSATQVPGRMERVDIGQPFTLIIDFAHTPDGLLNVLKAVRPLTRERVICLFGCGGDRDKGKRAEMGKIAGEGADLCVLTDDNPRGEDPAGLRREVEVGLRDGDAVYEVVGDRRVAIERVIELARPGDTVVIAGKGHENVQIVGDERIPFLDRQVAEEFLVRLERGR